jgi:hypothetical protein
MRIKPRSVASGTHSTLGDTRSAYRIFVVSLKQNIFGRQDEIIKVELN